MFCKKCGKQVPDGTRFCKFCGAPTGGGGINPPPPPPPPKNMPLIKLRSFFASGSKNTLIKRIAIAVATVLVIGIVSAVVINVQSKAPYRAVKAYCHILEEEDSDAFINNLPDDYVEDLLDIYDLDSREDLIDAIDEGFFGSGSNDFDFEGLELKRQKPLKKNALKDIQRDFKKNEDYSFEADRFDTDKITKGMNVRVEFDDGNKRYDVIKYKGQWVVCNQLNHARFYAYQYSYNNN